MTTYTRTHNLLPKMHTMYTEYTYGRQPVGLRPIYAGHLY